MRAKTLIALKCLPVLARELAPGVMHAGMVCAAAGVEEGFGRKVLQDLALRGLLKSMKGPLGGFALVNPLTTISDVMLACGEEPGALQYIGAEAFGAAVLYRKTTTMADLAKKARGRGVAA
jgi:DNA-binding IscR family transcriptional regulator